MIKKKVDLKGIAMATAIACTLIALASLTLISCGGGTASRHINLSGKNSTAPSRTSGTSTDMVSTFGSVLIDNIYFKSKNNHIIFI